MKFDIYFDVPFVLTSLTLLTGILALLDLFVFSKKRGRKHKVFVVVFEYARAFFPVFLLVLLIRSFLVQPFRVPTGSLAPTIMPGDFIVANQYIYGLRLPVLNVKVFNISAPQRGDIALFRYPENPGTLYVKRVIGVPGDHVVYRNKMLTINGKLMSQKLLGMELDASDIFPSSVQLKEENLDGVVHKIFVKPGRKEWENIDLTVPPNSYFMMGDNRDNSNDGREWGFVPEENLIGKVFGVWMSWDAENYSVRWERIGNRVR